MIPRVVEPTTPEPIERFTRKDPALHLYARGDLDPFFWPHTRWFGSPGPDGELRALALLYTGQDLPVLLAFGRDDGGALERLVAAIAPRLPARLCAHLSPGLLASLGERYRPGPRVRHFRMELRDHEALTQVDPGEVQWLGPRDRDELEAFYAHAYPGNWFDPRMLETERSVGIRRGGELVCVAGLHVCSPGYRVAALGNVATARAQRGQGLARRATAALCQRLLADGIETLGLNVAADNAPAIACYERLGFVSIAEFDELVLDPA